VENRFGDPSGEKGLCSSCYRQGLAARTPDCHDVITFDEHAPDAGESRGIVHFGFRLVSPGDIDAAVDEAEREGGKLLRRGEFSPLATPTRT
jgi:hypothetical protein